jgi:hypothetical protein
MHSKFQREVAAAALPERPASTAAVTEQELAGLPPAAQRYLRFMGVVGRPRDWSFRARLKGRFRTGPGAPWKRIEALQYSSGGADVARLFYMKLPFHGVPVLGRDTYLRGKGRLLVRVLDLLTVQDGQGMEFDLGELVTWLNDAVLMAPSMLLVPATTWTAADDTSFGLEFTDRGNTVAARVFLDDRGAPFDFHTRDRWFAPPGARGPPVRALWTTPVSGWQLVEGRMHFAEGRATWKLPGGDLTYAEFRLRPGDVVFNVPPGAPAAR